MTDLLTHHAATMTSEQCFALRSSLVLGAGASLAVGIDTDPVAVRAAGQNGVLNRFEGRWVTLQCGPLGTSPDPVLSNPQGFELPTQFDRCVANILQVWQNLKHSM